ncbi:MAG: CCA tRNA nucleotidyltransferase, partial [Verrucomicrobiota bacterium]
MSQERGKAEDQRRGAERILRRLQEAGFTTYFAGGCVRDQLLGEEPKDYDIATAATPKEVRGLFPRSGFVGAHFGVTLVQEPEGAFEVATFRADGSYEDGRRPNEVVFTTAEEDAQRRDFTINGLFQDPVANEIIDFVGGRADLEKGRLRAIGNAEERFQEDLLRLLRAVRFSARFGFPMEEATLAALRRAAPRLGEISAERIRDEVIRILLHPTRTLG